MRRGTVVRVVLLGAGVACAVDAVAYGCTARLCAPHLGPNLGVLVAASALAGATALVATARAVHIARAAVCELARLPTDENAMLDRAAHELQIPSPTCVAADELFAVCAGVWHPRVFVSRGLARSSDLAELRAILRHEAHHAARRHPLRRALRCAFADAWFLIPIVAWWADRAAIRDELAADTAATHEAGSGPLARALLRTGGRFERATAELGGAASVRVRRLADGTVRLPRPSVRLCLESVLAIVLLTITVLCL